jgi:two-component system sensor histidine kinase BaeS
VIAFAIAGVLAAAAIGVLLSRGITRPLARLATSMESVAPDGLPPPAGVTGSDEVGALGRRFDQLLEALRRHDAELRALSGTVAHEVRNPLGAMSGFAELLARAHPDADTKRMTDGIREEVAALERLVTRFLAYAGDVRVHKKTVGIHDLVEDAVRAAIPPGSAVTLERTLPPAGATFEADPDLLGEVLVNLLRNAAQATGNAGKLAVGVTEREGRVEIRVTDDGPGIAKEIRDRMFQPFATTKADGTGLGLAICRRIVTGHGGTLSFESDASGTTFVVALPKGTAPWPAS